MQVSEQEKGAILRALSLDDPFAGFEPRADATCWGWNSTRPIFEHLIRGMRPRRIIEVGTWLGASAVVMARLLRQYECDGAAIICVDTFLGSKEHWQHEDGRGHLALRHGFPTLYEQFMSNVANAGLQESIVPLPLPSAIAARVLGDAHLDAQLVYIDGSHEEEDALADMRAYWKLIVPGGALFGDDWTWESIRNAVVRFSGEIGVPFEHDDINWVFYKPQ